MRNIFTINLSVVIFLFSSSQIALADYSINVGANAGFVPDGSYTQFMAGFEASVNDSITLGGRVNSFKYDIDESDGGYLYTEEGSGTGAEFVFRFYTSRRALHGFYIGAAAGIGNATWDWNERACSTCSNFKGDGESSLLSLAFVMGGKIHFGQSNAYIEPSLNIAQYIAIATETSDGSDEVELGLAPSVGLAFGMVF